MKLFKSLLYVYMKPFRTSFLPWSCSGLKLAETPDRTQTLTLAAADVSLEYDMTISVLILSEARWSQMRAGQLLLARNIDSEGVPIRNAR